MSLSETVRQAARWDDGVVFVRRHWVTMLLCVLAGGLAVAAWVSTIPNRYQATARVLIDRSGGESAAGGDAASSATARRDAEFMATEYQLITSRPVLNEVLQALQLAGVGPFAQSSDPDGVLAGMVRVDPVRGTRLADLHVTSTDPMQAMQIANAMAETYARLNLQRRQQQAAGGIQWLREEVARAEARMRAAQDQVSADLHRSLSQRLSELELIQHTQSNNVQIVNPAELPTRPVAPRRARIVLQGLLLGLAIGCGIAFARELTTTAIRMRRDLETLVNLPFLGHVVHVPMPRGRGQRPLFFIRHPDGVAAESLRAVRTTLEFLLPERPTQRVLITSSLPQEGKSTVGANLAVSLQELGRRVVIIDADMRRPALYRAFQVPIEPGLSTYLQGKATLEEILQAPAQAQGVTVITSGAASPRPADLLAGPPMGQLLDQLSASFQYVVLDTPPVLAVADATILSRVVDSAVLVVRADRTTREDLFSAHRVLAQSPLKFLGTILNDVRPEFEYRYDRRGYSYYATQAPAAAPGPVRAASAQGLRGGE